MTSVAWFDPLRYGTPPTRPPGPPPSNDQLQAERALLHAAVDGRTPDGVAQAHELNLHGPSRIWQGFAREYRQHVGAVRGWAGTGLMTAASGAASLAAQGYKWRHREPRPFVTDPTLPPIGPIPRDPSFPSGHASSAYAAATVLGSLWPERAREFEQVARLVGQARVYSAVHYPSDVAAGARLGVAVARTLLHPGGSHGVTPGAVPFEA